MTGEVGAHTNRPELVAIHGYDTKFAMHALRLGYPGRRAPHQRAHHPARARAAPAYLRAIRRGEVELGEVIAAVDRAEQQLELTPRRTLDLPEQPDRDWVDSWLHRSHEAYWTG